MAQRLIRSDDTSKWVDGYGQSTTDINLNGTSTETLTASACTGTAAATTLSATNASFTAGDFLYIHQTQGTGVGNCEFNKILSYVAGTITLAYPLINTYVSGAQVLVTRKAKNATYNGAGTWSPSAWNGTTGGIYVLFANGTVSIGASQILGGTGLGFRGTASLFNTSTNSQQGEGDPGVGANSLSANSNGAGGALNSNAGDIQGGNGGGHATTGTTGANPGAGSTAGAAVGTADLTTMHFGGAGAGGMAKIGTQTGSSTGGASGPIVIIIAANITVTGAINANGAQASGIMGESGSVRTVTAGSGAGSIVRLAGGIITVGTSLVTALGPAGLPAGGTQPFTGGKGSDGRIAIDYGISISGTTNPAANVRQDSTFVPAGSLFMGQI